MINVKDFGAVGDGIADDTTAINRAFAASGHVLFPTGTYRHSAELTCIRPDVVHIAAEAGTVLMGVGSGFTSLRIGGAPVGFDPFALGDVRPSRDMSAADSTIEVPGLRAQPGDILRISSTQVWDEVSRHGEMAEVDAVSGATFTLTRPLFGSYRAAETRVIRLTMPTVNVSNLTIVRASNDQGLLMRCARNVDVNNIRVSGARYAGIVAQFIYGGEIRNCSSRDGWYAGTGTSYGLEVSTAQDLDIHSNNLYGGRHALTLGNYEPNRFVSIRGNTIANKPSETVGALNTHGGAQFITITDNKVSGGCEIAATDVTFSGNTIIGDVSAAARPVAIFYFSRDSDYLIVSNNVFRSTARAAGQSPLHVRFTRQGVTARVVRISGNIISGRIDQAQGGIWIAPGVSAGTGASCRIERLEVLDNDVELSRGSSAAYALLVNDQGGGPGFYPIIESAVVRGGRYVNPAGRAIGFINLNPMGARSGDVVVSDLAAESPSQAVYAEGLATMAVVRNRIDGGGTVYMKDVTGLIDIRENRIFNASVNSGIELGPGNGEDAVIANFYFNSRGVPGGGRPSRSGPVAQGNMNVVTWGTGLPVSGTHRQGDVRWRTDVVPGGSPGWICTVSGTVSGYEAGGGVVTAGSPVITGLSSTLGLRQGDYLSISGGFASPAVRVEAVEGQSRVVVSEAAVSSSRGVSVRTPDPVWKAMAAVSA